MNHLHKSLLKWVAPLALVGVASALILGPGESPPEGAQKIPSRLPDRHSATLSGRMDRVQTGYVDLYAPLLPSEARALDGYRAPKK